MFKYILASGFVLMFLTGCVPQTEEAAIDINNLYAQTCESENGPCKLLLCSLQETGYHCAETVTKIAENCVSKTAPNDDVLGNYFICGEDNAESLNVYNYSTKILPKEISGLTPAELETKIEEETEAVENGGTSSFLQTMLAVTAGSLLAGAISRSMFGTPHAMPPKNPSGYSQPMNKDSLSKTKSDIQNNQSKLKNDLSSSKSTAVKKKTAPAAKKTTKTKRRTSFGRRRR